MYLTPIIATLSLNLVNQGSFRSFKQLQQSHGNIKFLLTTDSEVLTAFDWVKY